MSKLDSLADRWPAISALLDEVLALPPADRAAWLDALPAEREGLNDTLRALLATHAEFETGDFLGTLPKLSHGFDDAATAAAEARVGDTVGPYRLLEALGSGGMGDVWLAERADGELKRRVALKLPRFVWGGALAERMRRERDILASLAHPNIARLYDAGVDHNGRPYLALEYVEGEAIDIYCRARELPLGARLDLLLQACAAVAHAHSRLVVHRDLKPSNMLVTRDGEVRLLDFGIAKLMQSERTADTALTRLSGRAMTLDYASPEQIRGEPLGTASDVYSLAVVAYELLAGAKPYRLKRGSAAELEEAIAQVDPPRASDVAEPAMKRQLRGDLDAILNKALKKDPALRYATIAAFADDLQRHLEGRAVHALPDSRQYRTRKFVGRNRLAVAAAVLVGSALGTGLGVSLWQAAEAREQATRAQRGADREQALSTLYLETLTTVAGWDPAKFAEPDSVPRLMLRKLDELEQRFKDAPEHRLAMLEAVATQLPNMRDVDGAIAVSRRLIGALRQAGASPDALLTANTQAARTLLNVERRAEAEAWMTAALAAPRARDASPVVRARALGELGSALEGQGKRVAAAAALNDALALLPAPADSKLRGEVLQTLSRVHSGFDSPAALRAAEEALTAISGTPLIDPAYVSAAFMFLGAALAENGRAADAERALRESHLRDEALYGEVDRDTVKAIGRLAHAISAQGRFDEASAMLDRRAETVRARGGPDLAFALQTLRTHQLHVALSRGDLDAAGRFAAAAGTEVAAARSDPIEQLLLDTELMRATGRAELALRLLKLRLQMLGPEQRVGKDAFRLALAIAETRADAGDHVTAVSAFLELLAAMKAGGATRNWTHRQAVESAAVALAAIGRAAEAAALLRELKAEAGATPAFTISARADSAWRWAQVWLAVGDRARALAMVEAMKRDLAGQHPASPRLLRARQLAGLPGA